MKQKINEYWVKAGRPQQLAPITVCPTVGLTERSFIRINKVIIICHHIPAVWKGNDILVQAVFSIGILI